MLPTFSKNFAKTAAESGEGSPQVADSSSGSGGDGNKKDVRTVLAWVIFIFSLLGAGGMFALNVSLDGVDFVGIEITGKIQKTEQLIVEQEAAIQPQTIQELVLFDQQIETLRSLNSSRAGYLVLLDALSDIIIPTVRFTSATMSLEGDSYRVLVQAVALNLPAYLQQVRVLRDSNNPLVKKVTVDTYSINRDEAGRNTVNFSMSLVVPVSEAVAAGVVPAAAPELPIEDIPELPIEDI